MRSSNPGSLPDYLYRFLDGMVYRPGETLSKTFGMVKQLLSRGRAKKAQDELIRINFNPDTRKLIAFLVPGINVVSGGTMSICSLAKISAGLKSVHNSEVLIATLPASSLFTKYTYFDNPFDIYRFEQLYSYFTGIEELTLHLPEFFVTHFLASLTDREKVFLKNIPRLKINILNQNVWLMPPDDAIDRLKELTGLITCTTAHPNDCTVESRNYYDIPFHYFSASNLTEYYYSPYWKKEDVMVISHDKHRDKGRILRRLRRDHPEINLIKIENMAYEKYKKLLSRAKWAITFGEGIDGYFMESIRSGAIPFAVYNKDFFSDRFMNLPNVYQSFEDLYNHLSDDLRTLDQVANFEDLSKRLIELNRQEYDDEKYKENVRRYYLEEYDLP
jgi:hypothetical protein